MSVYSSRRFEAKAVMLLTLLFATTVLSPVGSACPVPPPDRGRLVWADLTSEPSNMPMDLCRSYDRASVLQLGLCGVLLLSALFGAVLIVERSICFSRAARQNNLYLSHANDALAFDRSSEALRLAEHFPLSPVAFLVRLSLIEDHSGSLQLSTNARQVAVVAKTIDIARGLAALGAIGMTAPLIGVAGVAEGLIRSFHTSQTRYISSDVLGNWIEDWLVGLVFALLLSAIVIWAHRLLAARANRLLLEMDHLSLGLIQGILNSTERERSGREFAAILPANERFSDAI